MSELKQYYRTELTRMNEYIKLSRICYALGLSQSNLSWFLKGRDERMSIENLKRIYEFIQGLI